MKQVTDLTKGIYRRIYSGFIMGRRINSVSMQSEAWFWRLQAIADDFGNLRSGAEILKGTCAPCRRLTAPQIDAMTKELVAAKLISTYTIDGEVFIHVADFETLQPAGRNGKRIRRVPGPSDASGCIPVNPDPSSASDSDSDSDSERIPPVASATAPGGGSTAAASRLAWKLETGWIGPDAALRGVWALAYPACDLDRQLAAMDAWLRANPTRAKKSNWARFATNWLAKEQDRGGDARGGRGPSVAPLEAAAQRRAAKRAGEFAEELTLPVKVIGRGSKGQETRS